MTNYKNMGGRSGTLIACAECLCAPERCKDKTTCGTCKKQVCCCAPIHRKRPQLQMQRPRISIKNLYAAALGIEIICIAAAEIGENMGLYLFGFNAVGIPVAYAMGYALAGFATFLTILGRGRAGSCCSDLVCDASKGLGANLKMTAANFARGAARLPHLARQPNMAQILKSSLYILVTAESACILTAETVNLVLYGYSLFLSVPLALLAGALAIVIPAVWKQEREWRATFS